MPPATDWRKPVWLLSTKGREQACQAVLDQCAHTEMCSTGIVYVDGDTYPNLRLPANWHKVEGRKWNGIRAGMHWVFHNYPQASHYGWLADDTLPQTKRWDSLVEEATSGWGLTSCRDNWLSEGDASRRWLLNGGDLGAGICWGGELVRFVGWWAPAFLKQGGIDFVWTSLLWELGVVKYLPEVTVAHQHWKKGARPRDEIDFMPHVEADVERAFKYVGGRAFQRLRQELTVAISGHSHALGS